MKKIKSDSELIDYLVSKYEISTVNNFINVCDKILNSNKNSELKNKIIKFNESFYESRFE